MKQATGAQTVKKNNRKKEKKERERKRVKGLKQAVQNMIETNKQSINITEHPND